MVQGVAATEMHVPEPLQYAALVSLVVVVQTAAVHTVVEIHLRQPPAPSHVPSVPQVDFADATPHPRVAGVSPAVMDAQVPSAPPVLLPKHDLQTPAQAESQQIPLLIPSE